MSQGLLNFSKKCAYIFSLTVFDFGFCVLTYVVPVISLIIVPKKIFISGIRIYFVLEDLYNKKNGNFHQIYLKIKLR